MRIIIERWQLHHIGTPMPLTPETIEQLSKGNSNNANDWKLEEV